MRQRAEKGTGTGEIDLRAVILAGGRGTRFWPLGRSSRPKQFLPIVSGKSMIEETVDRIRQIVPPDRTYFVADAYLSPLIKKLFPEVPPANIIIEPEAKNTGPAVVLATAVIRRENPLAVVAAFPADHRIGNRRLFLKKLKASARAAAREKAIITFGIPPSFPATAFGYINFDKRASGKFLGESFYPVRSFLEKPSLSRARKFLTAGTYLWNSGMFLWTPETFARELSGAAPRLFGAWVKIIEALDKKDQAGLEKAYSQARAVSIDYALLEKARRVMVCRGDFGWSDIGSWSSLLGVWKTDNRGNASRGRALFIDSERCLAYGPDKMTVVIGLKDLVVIDAGDALLICPAGSDQRVREAVEALKKRRQSRYL